MNNLPKIVKVEALDDYLLHVYLADNIDFIFDFKPCLDYPCNKELRNVQFFKRAKSHIYMVYWDDMHDIHLDQMIPEHYLNQAI